MESGRNSPHVRQILGSVLHNIFSLNRFFSAMGLLGPCVISGLEDPNLSPFHLCVHSEAYWKEVGTNDKNSFFNSFVLLINFARSIAIIFVRSRKK